ncbi:MAG TPA: histidine--tRNA ligase [Alphaproteobacteria bacterium]
MSDKKSIYKPRPISGFPEWLPEYRAVEIEWMTRLRRAFESYGYCSIETPAVEELNVIAAKGEVDKEIYVLERLHKDDNDKSEARLALHFDQTVPLARYVAQHFSNLTFPFKRYQMQKVWRGERPQLGRMREFYQCDIDVIHVDNLPIAFDAEVAGAIYEALTSLDIGRVQIRISNRKILLGLLEALNVQDAVAVTRTVDKLEKIGADAVRTILKTDVGMQDPAIDAVLQLAGTKGTTESLRGITAQNAVMQEGLDELNFVVNALAHLPVGAIIADLSIVRGLDYYTGTVYETALLDVPEYQGSVCSGGRYDDLAGNFISRHLPGVGISIGFSRLFDVLKSAGRIKPGRICPTDVLVALPSEERRGLALQTAAALRARGMNVELYHAPQKIGKQIEYADKKGIRYVWFPPMEDGQSHEVKDIIKGWQTQADPSHWVLPQT